MCRSRGGGGGGGAGGPDPPTLKNHKIIGFFSNTDPDPLKNHKAAKPAFYKQFIYAIQASLV